MFLSDAPSYLCQYPLAVLCYVYAVNGILSITVPLSGTLLPSCLLWHPTLVSTTTAVLCYVSTWFGILLSLVPPTVSLLLLFPSLLPFLSRHSLLGAPPDHPICIAISVSIFIGSLPTAPVVVLFSVTYAQAFPGVHPLLSLRLTYCFIVITSWSKY